MKTIIVIGLLLLLIYFGFRAAEPAPSIQVSEAPPRVETPNIPMIKQTPLPVPEIRPEPRYVMVITEEIIEEVVEE